MIPFCVARNHPHPHHRNNSFLCVNIWDLYQTVAVEDRLNKRLWNLMVVLTENLLDRPTNLNIDVYNIQSKQLCVKESKDV